MKSEQTSFLTGWLSIELEGYRDHPEKYNTYSSFPYGALPPLPTELFRGDFRWLKEASHEYPQPEDNPIILNSQIDNIADSASQLNLRLPDEFVKFICSADLLNRIRSCTDCYFELPDWIVEYPADSGGYLIRFLSDSQGCLFWYLYLTKAGDHCVVVSNTLYGSEWEDEEDSEQEHYVLECAPSFEEFIYRFWIENEIWYALSDEERPLTKEQQEYVNHYKKAIVT